LKGVILAAGKGTRMLPLTQRRPKPLVPVLDRPMIEHIICGARDAGFDHLCLVIGHLGEMIRDHLGDGSSLGVRLEYVWQEVAGGTGAATLLAEEFIGGDPFFLSWGDIIVGPQTYQNVARAWHEEHPQAVLSLNYVDDPWEGAAVYVEDGYITRIVEKPPVGTSTTNYNNAGIFIFGAEILDILKETPDSKRGEKEVPDAIQTLLGQGARIRGLEVEGYWSDVARPATVLRLSSTLINHRCASGVLVDETAEIAPGAELVAPVYIGPGCRVGNAVVGPDVALMGATSVGDGARLSRSMSFGEACLGAGSQMCEAIIEEGAVLPEGMALTGDAAAPAVLHKL
jgi:UDP-N-acetylglucosamine diphosphorylase / glucose-1-phosphate thymidylyltransferase / UDP-N-acetylgalactosamine diphosphorylase / glucosamine-1-phosphate N-acetyltransferase / galactosamine-1-phosphate N-acetyltransferase